MHRFTINLQCGPNVNPRDDLALHLSIRVPERVVVRNTLTMGQWGTEERQGGFPFVAGQGFEVLLLSDTNHYKVNSDVHLIKPVLHSLSFLDCHQWPALH